MVCELIHGTCSWNVQKTCLGLESGMSAHVLVVDCVAIS